MKPVDQEFLHDAKNNVIGDCFRACIASILEVPIDAVPHFVLLGSRWSKVMNGYLEALSKDIEWVKGTPPDGVWAIATVKSPRFLDGQRELLHSVIWRDGKVVHDPHPSRASMNATTDDITDYYMLTPDTPSPHTM